jgi:hypothetical protein
LLSALALAGCGGAGGDPAVAPAAPASSPSPPASTPPAPTLQLSANPSSVAAGGSTQLSWQSTGANSCQASGGWSGAKALSGSETMSGVSAATTYTLACNGAGGSISQNVMISIAPPPSPPPPSTPPAISVSLTASPLQVAPGSTADLSWQSTNATSCTASGGWSGSQPTSGSAMTGPLNTDTTFNLDCSAAGATTQRATATVTVAASGSAISGHVDSAFINPAGQNRVYVFTGNVTPHDYNGTSGDPITAVDVTQDANACTFSYAVPSLAAGTYTLAFTNQAQLDTPGVKDSITFAAIAVVNLGAGAATQNLLPATVLRVGPGRPFASVGAASAVAQDGAVIEIDAGTYPDDIVVWRQNGITVRGVGGRAHIAGTKVIPYTPGNDLQNGKGLWVVDGNGMRIENIELSGAAVTDQNGAGIRNEASNLTVCNGYLHDNENGFLGGAYGTLKIEYSTFAYNGRGDGYTHNIYVDDGTNAGDHLVFQYNYSHHAKIGHLLKTRARENYVLYSNLTDGSDGTSSYTVDVPNGGLTFLVGNLLQQGPNTDNPVIVAYGEEGLSSGRTQEIYAANNTLVNDLGSGGFFSVATGAAVFRSINNLYVGGGTVATDKASQSQGDIVTSSPGFVNRAGFDYHLTASSPARDAGVAQGSAQGFSLVPQYQYVDPAQRQVRPVVGNPDVGAYEFSP